MTGYCLTSFPESMPFVVKNMGQWVTENSLAFFKANTMFVDIYIRFSLVPFKLWAHMLKDDI